MCLFPLTVNGNGEGLGQGVSIGANKGWDLSEGVDLEEVGAHGWTRLGLDELNVEAIGFGDREDGL